MTKQEWENLENYKKAWKLYLIIRYMNDESAYYSGWLYIWPDGETYEQCMNDFESDEAYQDLERSFKAHYSDEEIHEAGLYSCKGVPQEVIEAAHYWDKELGLPPIEVVK